MTENDTAQITTTQRSDRCARVVTPLVNARARDIVRWATNSPARYFLEMLESVAAFLAVSAVVICTPGQDTALTIRNTLGGGRRSGIATAGGVATGQAIWTVGASFGIVALLSASEPVFRTLKLAGAAYLVYLGVQSLSAATRRNGGSRALGRGVPIAPNRALRQGAISNLGNPKMAVFFASLLPQFAPGDTASFAWLLAFGLLFCALTFGWLTLYAVAVARVQPLLAGPARRVLDALTGIVLVLFGARLAFVER
jgi:threonine/homoserine/homoserine lactone efflux protein